MPRPAPKAAKKTDAKATKKDPATLAAYDFFADDDDDLSLMNDNESNESPAQAPMPVVKQVEQKKAIKQHVQKPKAPVQRAKKRELSDDLDDVDDTMPMGESSAGAGDFGQEMQKMLEGFGADLKNTVNTKRKRLEQFTNCTIRNSNKKVEDIWRGQQVSRQKLTEEYCKQATSVFAQWETDLEKVREQEEKLQNLLKQQQKLSQQTRVIQSQRLKTIKQLHEEYAKNLAELDAMHEEQQGTIQSELKKEMALLQKRILMDTQQQEMATVRKSLQSMLF